MKIIPDNVKPFIANAFSHKLHAYLGERIMKQVVELNAMPEYKNSGSCATHNFCDPNYFMLEVLESMGLKVFNKAEELQSDTEQISEIWALAKNNNFQPIK